MGEPFEVRVVSVVCVGSEIDVATAPDLATALDGLPANGEDVIVDLSDVTFMDSTGLGVLVTAWNRCRGLEPVSKVALVVATPEVERLLDVAGLADVFDTYNTLDEAIRS
jgi:anti-sigma B factor antagonist